MVPGTFLKYIKFFVFRFWLDQQLRYKKDSQSETLKLTGQSSLELAETRSLRTTAWLRQELQSSPTWVAGHLLLGSESLAREDVALAYACGQAVLLLTEKHPSESNEQRSEGKLLVAQCLLKRGAALAARELLEEVLGSLAFQPKGPLKKSRSSISPVLIFLRVKQYFSYNAEDAEVVFQRVPNVRGARARLKAKVVENLAAALLLEGREPEAAELLSLHQNLPMSSASEAVISYAKRKGEGLLPPLS